jgi:putative transposase
MNNLPQRKNIRLKGYDYSQNGFYFITICTNKRINLFGKIDNGILALNEYGEIVHNEWLKSEDIRKEINSIKFIVMPNHIHAILEIEKPVGSYGYTTDICINEQCIAGDQERTYIHTSLQSPSKTVGALIRGFKSSVTTKINTIRNTPQNPVWQSNYHDHIIRNQAEYLKIWQYIDTNPLKWQEDCYYEKDNC